MIWLVFRNKWFALAWVAMICAGIGLRFGLTTYLLGGDPATVLAQADAASMAKSAPESTTEQENRLRREMEQKQSERATINDADRPTVNVD